MAQRNDDFNNEMHDDTILRIEDPGEFVGEGEYHECRWLDFRSDNRDDEDVLEQVEALEPGQHVIIGGGAGVAFRVRRPCTTCDGLGARESGALCPECDS